MMPEPCNFAEEAWRHRRAPCGLARHDCETCQTLERLSIPLETGGATRSVPGWAHEQQRCCVREGVTGAAIVGDVVYKAEIVEQQGHRGEQRRSRTRGRRGRKV